MMNPNTTRVSPINKFRVRLEIQSGVGLSLNLAVGLSGVLLGIEHETGSTRNRCGKHAAKPATYTPGGPLNIDRIVHDGRSVRHFLSPCSTVGSMVDQPEIPRNEHISGLSRGIVDVFPNSRR